MRLTRGSSVVFAAATLAAVMAWTGKGSEAATPAEQSVNVIFHGPFSFVLSTGRVGVFAAGVSDHVYEAESWGKELRLNTASAYASTGVQAETKTRYSTPGRISSCRSPSGLIGARTTYSALSRLRFHGL